MSAGPIRVVVADDSLVSREMITQILSSDTGIEVVGQAKDGLEAVEMVERLRPDLVTMDIHMPRLDGLKATERIMAYTPTPILVVSSSVYGEGMGRAFDALRLGALEVIKKPEVRDWAELERIGREVISKAKILAKVRVITHISGRRTHEQQVCSVPRVEERVTPEIVVIGSSTGGPSALLEVLGGLPADFCVPMVIVQHIARGFVPGLVEWLDAGCALRVVEAATSTRLTPGVAYVAPSGHDIGVGQGELRLREPGAGQLYVPSVDALFESAAVAYGRRAVGVIMTGMGADGASGLKSIRRAGGTTIAQDESTCTVFGMPKAAIESGAVDRVVPLGDIGGVLERLLAG